MMGPLKAFLNRLVLATGKPQEPFRKERAKAQYKPARLKQGRGALGPLCLICVPVRSALLFLTCAFIE